MTAPLAGGLLTAANLPIGFDGIRFHGDEDEGSTCATNSMPILYDIHPSTPLILNFQPAYLCNRNANNTCAKRRLQATRIQPPKQDTNILPVPNVYRCYRPGNVEWAHGWRRAEFLLNALRMQNM